MLAAQHTLPARLRRLQRRPNQHLQTNTFTVYRTACPALSSPFPWAAPACLPAFPCLQKSDFEERLQRLSAQYRIPREGNTTVARVEAAARRVLQGQEVAWHSDILAKVGGWASVRSCAAWRGGCLFGCGGSDGNVRLVW